MVLQHDILKIKLKKTSPCSNGASNSFLDVQHPGGDLSTSTCEGGGEHFHRGHKETSHLTVGLVWTPQKKSFGSLTVILVSSRNTNKFTLKIIRLPLK